MNLPDPLTIGLGLGALLFLTAVAYRRKKPPEESFGPHELYPKDSGEHGGLYGHHSKHLYPEASDHKIAS